MCTGRRPAQGSTTWRKTHGTMRSIRLQGWLEKYSVSAPRWRKNWRSRLLVLWDDRICWHKGSLAWATDAAAGGLNRLEPETKVLRTPPIGGGTVLRPMRALSWQRFVGLGHRCRSGRVMGCGRMAAAPFGPRRREEVALKKSPCSARAVWPELSC